MSYAKRAITATFTLGAQAKPPTFTASGGAGNTVTAQGLRIQAIISQDGGPGQVNASLRIFGMPMSVMNQISTMGKSTVQTNFATSVSISAGEVGGTMSAVFQGHVQQAWVDAASLPDVALVAMAFSSLADQMNPAVAPTSYAGMVDAAVILQGLATQMGRRFENNGVSVMLSNPYYPGTAMQQAQRCAEAAHINMLDDGGTLAIWPIDGARDGAVPMISPETGMVGYPAYTQAGLDVTTLYNPAIRCGGQVKIQSSITPACGVWPVSAVEHTLESETPGGAWFTRAKCLFWGGPQGFTPND